MTEKTEIERMKNIINFNRFISKGTRRWMLRWITKAENDMQVMYEDIQKIKQILVLIAKKVKVEGMEIPEDFLDDEEIEATPKSEDDLKRPKPMLSREGGMFI